MLFAFSIPAQVIRFFQFKEVIRAVVIKDIFSAFDDVLTVFVKLGLYKIILFRKNRERPVAVIRALKFTFAIKLFEMFCMMPFAVYNSVIFSVMFREENF